MGRYIDADALKDDILKSAVMIDDRGIQTGYEIAIELIKRQPTIDAEAVRHGEWLPGNLSMGAYWVCSCCGFPSEAHGAFKIYKYCPNCGANMKGENNG